MNLIDANILLYAQDSSRSRHESARDWLDAELSGEAPVGLCWQVLTAFLRIASNPRVFGRPLTTSEAVDQVEGWLGQPNVRLLVPSTTHWTILRHMLEGGQATGNLVADAHLAALAVEHNCVLCSTDMDFARFPGLHWRNPLV